MSRGGCVQLNKPLSSFLAFDLGHKRTGLAYGTMILSQASPVGVVQAEGDKRFEAFSTYIQTWQPDALVVGIPYHPDGVAHENTRFAKKIAQQLKSKFNLNVFEIDERYSTTQALSLKHSAQSKSTNPTKAHKDVDALSACIILDQFFSEWHAGSLQSTAVQSMPQSTAPNG